MKKYIVFAFLIVFALPVLFTACEEDFSSKEYYKYLVYLLSKENHNVYPAVFAFDGENEVTNYFSVACGGSLANPEEIRVNLELDSDTTLFRAYNTSNFDIDTSKFALILPENRYRIGTMDVVFPANNSDQYVKVPVTVNINGLSPDSTYFIPLAIKSVSKFEVNPEKYNMLFRVVLENQYAEMLLGTYYTLKGNILNANEEALPGSEIATTKLARPLNENSIRVYAGAGPVKADFGEDPVVTKPTLEEIEKYGITLTVDEDNHVRITPFGTIEIDQKDAKDWNVYQEVRNNMVDDTVTKYFYLRYRYRTVKTPATDTTPAEYNNWVFVQETLKRLEN